MVQLVPFFLELICPQRVFGVDQWAVIFFSLMGFVIIMWIIRELFNTWVTPIRSPYHPVVVTGDVK